MDRDGLSFLGCHAADGGRADSQAGAAGARAGGSAGAADLSAHGVRRRGAAARRDGRVRRVDAARAHLPPQPLAGTGGS